MANNPHCPSLVQSGEANPEANNSGERLRHRRTLRYVSFLAVPKGVSVGEALGFHTVPAERLGAVECHVGPLEEHGGAIPG